MIPAYIHDEAVIHPLASVGLPGDHREMDSDGAPPIEIGAGTVVREFCVIKRALAGAPSARGTTIGKDCLLMTAVHVYEGCCIGDCVEINVRATLCGYVDVMDGARIGAGAIIHPGVTIGEGALVGLGAAVIEDVPPESVVVGNPARTLRRGNATPDQLEAWEHLCRRKPIPESDIAFDMMEQS